MTKIQVTDSADEKKPVEKSTKAVQKSPKKVVRKAVDARVAVPKPIKKITIGKEEKAEKVKKPAKQTKPVKKVRKIKLKQTETKLERPVVKSKQAEVKPKQPVIEPKQAEVKPKQPVIEPKQPAIKPKQPKITHSSAAASSATHNFLQKSTTLSRRYVKLPKITQVESPKIKSEKIKQAEAPKVKQSDNEPKLLNKEALKLEFPKSEAPKLEAAKSEAPKLEAAKSEAPKLEAAEITPAISAPKTVAEVTPITTPTAVPVVIPTIAPKVTPAVTPSPAVVPAPASPSISTTSAVSVASAPTRSKADIKAAKRAEKAKKLAIKQAAKAAKIAESRRIAAAKRAESISKKDKAIKSAMHSVATMNETGEEMHNKFHKKRKGGRILLAMFCSAVTVAGLVAFVHFNMPDISVKVAAIQTGIDASYPSIIPRGYTLKNVSSDKDGEIAMTFENSEGYSFSLTEEKSTWDSNALLNNYVKKNFSKDYSTMREQGITIYSDSESAAWVNGGILYKVKSYIRNLSKEQIRNLATSIQ